MGAIESLTIKELRLISSFVAGGTSRDSIGTAHFTHRLVAAKSSMVILTADEVVMSAKGDFTFQDSKDLDNRIANDPGEPKIELSHVVQFVSNSIHHYISLGDFEPKNLDSSPAILEHVTSQIDNLIAQCPNHEEIMIAWAYAVISRENLKLAWSQVEEYKYSQLIGEAMDIIDKEFLEVIPATDNPLEAESNG